MDGEGAKPLIYSTIPQISSTNNIFDLIYRMCRIESNIMSVYDGENFIGIVFLKDALYHLISVKRIKDGLNHKVTHILCRKFHKININEDIDSLLNILKNMRDFSPIIVLDRKKVVGYIYVKEFVDILEDKKYIWNNFLNEIGTIKLFRFLNVKPNSTVKKVIKLFKKYGVSVVPVIWRGRIKGVITQKILAEMLLKKKVLNKISEGVNGYFSDTTCTTIMDRNIPFIEDTRLSIEDLLDSIRTHGYSIILNEDEKKIVDIIFDINVLDFIKRNF